MENLQNIECTACRADAEPTSPAEIRRLMTQLPEWRIKQVDGVNRLERVYHFKNFKTAMAFAQQVGDLAEQVNHHPAILVEWGRVTVTWWTHKIKGLHLNDFEMAAKTDTLT